MNKEQLKNLLQEIRRNPDVSFTPGELKLISELFDLLLENTKK